MVRCLGFEQTPNVHAWAILCQMRDGRVRGAEILETLFLIDLDGAMKSSVQVRLCSALEPCLRLLARMMLRSGIGYTQFADLAKMAFVEEALGDRDTRGRATNLSRVAIRTGISRKEVSRIKSLLSARQIEKKSVGTESDAIGHAARVLQLWHADKRFIDQYGQPRDLPFGGDGVNFNSLVKAAGGDVPPGAVRAELVDAGAAVESDDGFLEP